jgi:hypothetical protein
MNLLRRFSKIVGRTQPFIKVDTGDETSGLPVIRPQSNAKVFSGKIQCL